MNTPRRMFLGGALLCGAFQISAQQLVEPPKVLVIYREQIKQGKEAVHEKVEAKYMQASARLKSPENILGLVALTGPAQAWFLGSHDSFASIDETQTLLDKPASRAEFGPLEAQDGDLRTDADTWIAAYRPDLSYRGADMAAALPKAHYFNVVVYHVRQDHDSTFEQLAKIAIEAAEKSSSDLPTVLYQVVSGTNVGTYLAFQAMPALKTMDGGAARGQALMKAMGEKTGGFFQQAADAIANEQNYLFVINPKMSYVSKEFAAGNPDFWNTKPAPAKKTP